ncbi:hypothetical protein IHV10_12730 [Fictibacillus sp. 5RED26]|uniref:hypothetical protein n=1 Tax=Fictibacillus sp. 5RED26 TaxID=2745876 RepID=UPI0018CE22FF|nr:hypothetical protein [Fictibacillus sp. 5RED26]MBH0157239.1 hypothetical protein [Fictibacillus sp. 5RED26]
MNKSKSVTFLATLLLTPFLLTGCIGEDYYESPPEAFLQVGDELYKLKEGNRKWNFTEGEYDKEYISLKEVAAKEKQISVNPGSSGFLIIEQNEIEGMNPYSGVSIGVVARKGEDLTMLNDADKTFFFPKEKGNYVLEIDFDSDQGDTEFVANIKVE